MSDIGHKLTRESAMNAITRQNRFQTGLFVGGGPGYSASAARLQVIHELVRSGDYHVPATAIADRMIEQMVMIDRRQAS
jgi:anti-sigma28 factor (negative regulator of flagellin synthesis)